MTTDPARFRRLMDLVGAAAELPASEREAYLIAHCDDAALRAEAAALLAGEEDPAVERITAALEARVAAEAASLTNVSMPESIGGYRVTGILGEGGMGVVYRARQEQPLKREVALKVMRRGLRSPGLVARFEAERRTLAALDHPGIARIFDAGTTDDRRPFFTMELVAGEPITRWCESRRLGIPARIALFRQVLGAVQYAHQRAIVHRDLKPSNILVTEVDGVPTPKVIDFGIARVTGDEPGLSTAHTAWGTRLGTLEYMSPEQALSPAEGVDTRADVYSLGVVLYELVTGRLPIESEALRGATPVELERILRHTDPPTPSRLLTGTTSGEFDWVVMKALEKDPERRYQSAREFALDLERLERHEPVSAAPPSLRYRAMKFLRRRRGPALAAAVALVAIVAGGVLAGLGFVGATRAQRLAEREARKAEQVNAFLVEMLSAVRPSRARGGVVSVRDVLDSAAARLERDTAGHGDLDVDASIRFTIGESYQALGEFGAAIPFFARALAIWRDSLPGDDERLLTVLNRLGYAHLQRGDFAGSLVHANEILRIRERTVGRMHAEYSAALQNIANTHADMGDLVKADSLLREALAIDRVVLTGDSLGDIVFTLNNLATVQSDLGRFEEAAAGHRESLALRVRFEGAEASAVGISLGNLGYALTGAGRIPEALDTLERARAVLTRALGARHVRVAYVDSHLGEALRIAGRLDEAEAAVRRAVTLLDESLGAGNWRSAWAEVQLGRIARDRGRAEGALTRLEAGYRGLAASLGATHHRTREAARDVADLLDASGRPAQAAPWRERSGTPAAGSAPRG